jgi:hypothetical protein
MTGSKAKCDFSATTHEEGVLDSMVRWYPRKTPFCYLGSMLLNDRDIDSMN